MKLSVNIPIVMSVGSILFFHSTLIIYDLEAFYISLLMFYMHHYFVRCFEQFNVIALYKFNIVSEREAHRVL